MEKITKHDFEVWRKKNRWLLFGEAKSSEGFPQQNFLTATGEIVVMIYDLDGNVRTVGKAMVQAMPSMPVARSLLDPRGGSTGPPGFRP